ncbi:MAG: hypothetical protein Q4E51_05140 [Lachnospiraceae bacterium]|nr:hypothetical protein [Lachnospiraceae bacterium]
MADVKITELAKIMNNDLAEGKKLIKVNQLHKWLKAKGYVENKKDKNGKTYKRVTAEGKTIGIKNVKKEYGDYTIMFAKKAQKYFVENLEDIHNQLDEL